MKKNYGPDPRNLGGRRLIIDNLYNHHVNLCDMKPVMKITKPRAHVDDKKRK